MIVVSDTTPLISLMKIERLDLLEKLYGKVFIPAAVYNELIVNKRFPEEAERNQKMHVPRSSRKSSCERTRTFRHRRCWHNFCGLPDSPAYKRGSQAMC